MALNRCALSTHRLVTPIKKKYTEPQEHGCGHVVCTFTHTHTHTHTTHAQDIHTRLTTKQTPPKCPYRKPHPSRGGAAASLKWGEVSDKTQDMLWSTTTAPRTHGRPQAQHPPPTEVLANQPLVPIPTANQFGHFFLFLARVNPHT